MTPPTPDNAADGGINMADSQTSQTDLEEREVRAQDPALSEHTNARVTEELRETLGRDRVRVPADRPRASRGEQPPKAGALDYLTQNRLQAVRAFFIVLTFGLVVALITDEWWVLALAAGVHAVGTMVVTLTALGLTTVTEHPSPELSAAMTEEGVSSPDDRFSRMVDEFREGDTASDTTGVLSPGEDARTVEASADPATAGAEQSSAMTPTAGPSEPSGEGGAPDFIIWATALSLAILSVVLPAVTGGGYMWLLTAVMLPLLAGWVLLQRALVTHGDAVEMRSRKPLVVIVLFTAISVAVFCGVVALAFQH
jgi:hypothetical protein